MSNHVQLVTADRPLYLAAKGTNVTATISSGHVNAYSTTTTPATRAGTTVLGGAMNYMKITPRWDPNATAPALKVIGWSRCNDSGVWVGHALTDVTATLSSDSNASVTILGTALRSCTTFVKNQGDCKIFSSTGLNSNAFIVVDTLGYDLIELCFRVSNGTGMSCNAHIGDI